MFVRNVSLNNSLEVAYPVFFAKFILTVVAWSVVNSTCFVTVLETRTTTRLFVCWHRDKSLKRSEQNYHWCPDPFEFNLIYNELPVTAKSIRTIKSHITNLFLSHKPLMTALVVPLWFSLFHSFLFYLRCLCLLPTMPTFPLESSRYSLRQNLLVEVSEVVFGAMINLRNLGRR